VPQQASNFVFDEAVTVPRSLATDMNIGSNLALGQVQANQTSQNSIETDMIRNRRVVAPRFAHDSGPGASTRSGS
jgi:hypothetical protein